MSSAAAEDPADLALAQPAGGILAASGGIQVAASDSTNLPVGPFLLRLSMRISDPFLRQAFGRAESEDGIAPAVAAVEPR